MTATPDIQPLSQRDRRNTFIVLVTIFVLAVPTFVFYAMGYRYDFWSEEGGGFLGTGGLYIASMVEETDIYLDEAPVRSPRVFRRATYMQGLTPGLHRVHVQGTGLQTWVKELPVLPHIVTEGGAFTLPVVPQLRPVPEFISQNGVATYPGIASTSLPFSEASSSIQLVATSSQYRRTLVPNTEYAYVESLFASTTSTSTSLMGTLIGEVNTAFRFGTIPASRATTTATTTVVTQDVTLFFDGTEVFVQYTDEPDRIPYYYCVTNELASTTAGWYGEHVAASVQAVVEGVWPGFMLERNDLQQVCRTRIKIDRLRQEVIAFDFLPGSSDHVLMHLTDGVYVVEIDDRSWQNTQLLYPGEDIAMVVDGRQIFVKDGEYYAEVFTELIES